MFKNNKKVTTVIKASMAVGAVTACVHVASANEKVASVTDAKLLKLENKASNTSVENEYVEGLISSGKLSKSEKEFLELSRIANNFEMKRNATNVSNLKEGKVYSTSVSMGFDLGELEAWDESEKEYFTRKDDGDVKGYPTLDLIYDLLSSNKTKDIFEVSKSAPYIERSEVECPYYAYDIKLDDSADGFLKIRMYKSIGEDDTVKYFKYDVSNKKLSDMNESEYSVSLPMGGSFYEEGHVMETIDYSYSKGSESYYKRILGVNRFGSMCNYQNGVVASQIFQGKDIKTEDLDLLKKEASKMMEDILKTLPEESIHVRVYGVDPSDNMSLVEVEMIAQKESNNIYSINTVVAPLSSKSNLKTHEYTFYDETKEAIETTVVDLDTFERLEIDHQKVLVKGDTITTLCNVYHSDSSEDLIKVSDDKLNDFEHDIEANTHAIVNLNSKDLSELIKKSNEIIDSFTTYMSDEDVYVHVIGDGVKLDSKIGRATESITSDNYKITTVGTVTGDNGVEHSVETFGTIIRKVKTEAKSFNKGESFVVSNKIVSNENGKVIEKCKIVQDKKGNEYYAKQKDGSTRYDYISISNLKDNADYEIDYMIDKLAAGKKR